LLLLIIEFTVPYLARNPHIADDPKLVVPEPLSGDTQLLEILSIGLIRYAFWRCYF